MWYLRVSQELKALGVTKCKYDEAIFYWHQNGKLQGVLTAHVDDFFWAGSDKFEKNIINRLTSTFKISSEQSENFKYI